MPFPQDAMGQAILGDAIALAAILITAIIGIVTIVVTKPKKKRVVYDIVSNKVVLETNKDVQSRIKSEFSITTGRVNVSNLCLLKMRIWNAGNDDILTKNVDYNQPLKFSFKGAKVVEATPLFTSPNDFINEVKIVLNNEDITFEPSFNLQSREQVMIELFLSNFNGNIEGKGRIAGVRRIERSNTGEIRYLFESFKKSLLLALGVFLSFLISTFISFINLNYNQKLEFQVTDVLFIGLIALIWLIFILRSKYKRAFSMFWSIILVSGFFTLYLLLHNIILIIFLHIFPGH